jgi:hypothetical protein
VREAQLTRVVLEGVAIFVEHLCCPLEVGDAVVTRERRLGQARELVVVDGVRAVEQRGHQTQRLEG